MAVAISGEQVVRVGELELAYETFGDPADPALLLIMGIGAQMVAWPDGFCELCAERGFHAIRFDNRDCGRSTVLERRAPPRETVRDLAPDELPYTLADMAGDAVGLLDALGIAAAHVCGSSMGGMIAQRVAIHHAKRVLSLASIMSTTGDSSVGLATEAARAVLLTRPPDDHDGYVEWFLDARRVIGTKGIDEADVRRLAERYWERGLHPEGTARQLAAIIADGDRTGDLAAIQAPTVVIHGAEDPLIGFSGGEATAAAIPGSALVVIEGMGHDLPRWAWQRVADAIAENAARA